MLTTPQAAAVGWPPAHALCPARRAREALHVVLLCANAPAFPRQRAHRVRRSARPARDRSELLLERDGP